MRRATRGRAGWADALRAIVVASVVALGLAFVGCGADTTSGDGERPTANSGTSEPESSVSEGPEATEIEIPDVTGGDLESAVSDIEGEGLSVEYAGDEPEDASLCTVSDQDPVGGDPAEDGDAVTLTVECRVLVPDMTEQPAEDALADLEDAGLDPSYEVEPPDASVCTVSDQSVAIDDEVDEGEPISLTLACEVPDVASEDPDSAASTLEGAGFTSTTDTYPSDPSLCTVESQDPEGSADLGAEISLTLDCLDEDDGY